jgi:hypothetical protein
VKKLPRANAVEFTDRSETGTLANMVSISYEKLLLLWHRYQKDVEAAKTQLKLKRGWKWPFYVPTHGYAGALLALVVKRRISRPPGSLVLAVAKFLYSPKSYERVAEPIIADMQFEYCQALAEGNGAKAAWIRVRGLLNLWVAWGTVRIVKALLDVGRLFERI